MTYSDRFASAAGTSAVNFAFITLSQGHLVIGESRLYNPNPDAHVLQLFYLDGKKQRKFAPLDNSQITHFRLLLS